MRIGAAAQANYEGNGLKMQLASYGFQDVASTIHIANLDESGTQSILIVPDLGIDLDELIVEWWNSGEAPETRPLSVDQYIALWVKITELKLDHGDVSNPSNIVLFRGQFPILIDRTISADYVESAGKFPYTFKDVLGLMKEDYLSTADALEINRQELPAYLKRGY